VADITYPYTQITATFGEMESIALTIYSNGDNGPEGTDLDSVVAVVRAYLEGLPSISETFGYRNEVTQTPLAET